MAKKEDELNFETDNNKMASSEKLYKFLNTYIPFSYHTHKI